MRPAERRLQLKAAAAPSRGSGPGTGLEALGGAKEDLDRLVGSCDGPGADQAAQAWSETESSEGGAAEGGVAEDRGSVGVTRSKLKMPEVSPRGEPTSTVASPEVLEGVEMVTEPSKVVEPDIANALGMAAGVPLQMPAADEKIAPGHGPNEPVMIGAPVKLRLPLACTTTSEPTSEML